MNPLYRLGAEIAVLIALFCGALWYRHELIQKGIDERIAIEQASFEKWKADVALKNAVHDGQIKELNNVHDKELADLNAYWAGQPKRSVVLHDAACAGPLPKSGAGGSTTPPPAAVLQQDIHVHPDIGPALELLVQQADTDLANCRTAVGVDLVNSN